MINRSLASQFLAPAAGFTVRPFLNELNGGWDIRVHFAEARPARELALTFMVEAMDSIGRGRMAPVSCWAFKHHEDLQAGYRLPPFEVGEGAFLAYENPEFDRRPFAERASDLIRNSLRDGSPHYRPDYLVIDGPNYVISEVEHSSNKHQMRVTWYEKSPSSFLSAVRVHWPSSEEQGRSPFSPFIEGLMAVLPVGRN
jgi:hypothetical protein